MWDDAQYLNDSTQQESKHTALQEKEREMSSTSQNASLHLPNKEMMHHCLHFLFSWCDILLSLIPEHEQETQDAQIWYILGLKQECWWGWPGGSYTCGNRALQKHVKVIAVAQLTYKDTNGEIEGGQRQTPDNFLYVNYGKWRENCLLTTLLWTPFGQGLAWFLVYLEWRINKWTKPLDRIKKGKYSYMAIKGIV